MQDFVVNVICGSPQGLMQQRCGLGRTGVNPMMTVEACAYMIAEGIASRFAKANPKPAAAEIPGSCACHAGPSGTAHHAHDPLPVSQAAGHA